MTSFEETKSFKDRVKECELILEKHPGYVPAVVEKDRRCENIPEIDKKKFLIPGNFTVGQLVYVIRKRIKLKPEEGMFVFVDGTLPPTETIMARVYEDHMADDGFLYVKYTSENAFG